MSAFLEVGLNSVLFILQVRINFLPVGHTHEDIDQLFSRIGQRLLRVGAETIDGKIFAMISVLFHKLLACLLCLYLFVCLCILDFESVVQSGYTPSPIFEVLNCIADFKSILEPVLEDIHQHTKPLCFKILRSETGLAELYYRFTTGDKWLPEDDKKICLLKVFNLM